MHIMYAHYNEAQLTDRTVIVGKSRSSRRTSKRFFQRLSLPFSAQSGNPNVSVALLKRDHREGCWTGLLQGRLGSLRVYGSGSEADRKSECLYMNLNPWQSSLVIRGYRWPASSFLDQSGGQVFPYTGICAKDLQQRCVLRPKLELECVLSSNTWFASVTSESNLSDFPSRSQPHAVEVG